jgi:hypothetical protein
MLRIPSTASDSFIPRCGLTVVEPFTEIRNHMMCIDRWHDVEQIAEIRKHTMCIDRWHGPTYCATGQLSKLTHGTEWRGVIDSLLYEHVSVHTNHGKNKTPASVVFKFLE